MQQPAQWHDRHLLANTFNDLVEKLNSLCITWNPLGYWKILYMLRPLLIPEPDPLCMLLPCKLVLAKCKEEVPLCHSLDDNIQIHEEKLVDRVTQGICFIKSKSLAFSPAERESFVDITITGHISTAQQLSCRYHPPLVWMWLELMLFADQVFLSLKAPEEWQSLGVFTPPTKLHPELLEHIIDQQKCFY